MFVVIKGIVFLIIGLAVFAFTASLAVAAAVILGTAFTGWVIYSLVRIKFRNWRRERQAQVR